MIRLHQTFGAHAGRVLELDRDVIRFGRLPDNEVCFDAHADLDASGRHAEVRREGSQWVLVDVGSRNGTLVAGKRITRHVLTSGDEIEFGVGGPRIRIELLGTPAPGKMTAQATPVTPGGYATGPATPMPMGGAPVPPPDALPPSAGVGAPSPDVSLPIGSSPTPSPSPFQQADPTPITPSPQQGSSPGVPPPGYGGTPAPSGEPKRYGHRTVGMMIQAALAQAEANRQQGGNRSTAFIRAVAHEAAHSSSRRLKIAIALIAVLLVLTLAAVVALFFYARWQEEQLRDENVDLQRRIADLDEDETAERERLEERIQELNEQLSDQQEQTGARIAQDYDAAVYALIRTRSGRREVLCSAFAVRRDLLATNAHCVGALERAMGRGEQVAAYVNHGSEGVPVSRMWRHPRYDGDLPHSPDIGLVRIGGQTAQQVEIADMNRLRQLSAGDDVFVLGFPSAIAEDGAPVAGLTTGVVGRVTQFDGTSATPDRGHLVSHSAFSDDGTAGSPVFDREGQVVAINAGNFRARRRVVDTGTHVTRTVESDTPYAWAVRADLLIQLLAGLPE